LAQLRFLAVLLALCLTIGCKAQTAAVTGNQQQDTDRRIEMLIRAHFGLTPDINVALGTRKSSNFPGYDSLQVTLSRESQSQTLDFLISTDGKTLGRLQTYDVAGDPMFHIDVANRPVRGNPNAKVTVVNFDDLQCPYCARMHQTLYPATYNRYKDKVRFIYKDFPLQSIHPWATHAAINADCLGNQNSDAYWNYVDYVHAHGEEVNGAGNDEKASFATLDRIARQQATLAHLDQEALSACLTKQDDTRIKASLKEAMELGLDGAPALYINGERIAGALPAPYVWMAIDRALRAVGEQPPANPETPAKAGEGPAAKPAQ
jgi:protein-disulfide isomerase